MPRRATPRPEPLVTVDVVVEAGDWQMRPSPRVLARRAIEHAAASARARIAPDAEMAVILTDDAGIRVLNRRFRQKDKPTNVLSFPAAPPAGGRHGPLLGDVAVALETVRQEAEERQLAFADHLTHMIVHGFLHLLGYDHETGREAVVMERLETAILSELGIADPYAP